MDNAKLILRLSHGKPRLLVLDYTKPCQFFVTFCHRVHRDHRGCSNFFSVYSVLSVAIYNSKLYLRSGIKTHKENGKQLRLVEFTQEFIESNWCTKGHIGFIIEGKLEVNFNGNIIIFNSGDGLFITAGEKDKHISRVLSDVVKLILVEEI